MTIDRFRDRAVEINKSQNSLYSSKADILGASLNLSFQPIVDVVFSNKNLLR